MGDVLLAWNERSVESGVVDPLLLHLLRYTIFIFLLLVACGCLCADV